MKIARQIGKPAEQGRCLPKNEGSKLCLGLFTCSVIFRGVTALPSTSPGLLAAMEQWSSGISAELVEKAEKKELVELEPWLPLSSAKKPFLLKKSMCIHLVFKSKGGTFLLYSLLSELGNR